MSHGCVLCHNYPNLQCNIISLFIITHFTARHQGRVHRISPFVLIYSHKDDKAYYDAEMQNINNKSLDSIALPRRARYYQSMMDVDAIDSGMGYEAHSLILPDGCTKYFYNVIADMDKVPSDLQAFFRYAVNGETVVLLGREKLTDM